MTRYTADALRARLTLDFQALTNGVTDPVQIGRTYKALVSVATNILCSLTQSWGAGHDSTFRIPEEPLALIFGFLPFRDRIAVSHVCRRWRSIALAHPALWGDIEESSKRRHGHALALMALSRTGKYPVDISLSETCTCDDGSRLRSALIHHMEHIRGLSWSKGDTPVRLTLPAPLLSCIQGETLTLTHDFLGGMASSLRTIMVEHLALPEICPALSTLTCLRIEGPEDESTAANYDQLFTLCPRLESLHISFLNADLADMLPQGPAPNTLQDLSLDNVDVGDDSYDLMLHYTAWKTGDNLRNVALGQDCADIADLPGLIGGAVTLYVGTAELDDRAEIAATGADGWRRSVGFPKLKEPEDVHIERIETMLTDARGTLTALRTLEIEATYLRAVLPLLRYWPALTHLTLRVEPFEPVDGSVADNRYNWERLACLAALGQHSPSLASLVILVMKFRCREPPDAEEARAMLENVARCDVPEVLVRGFSRAVLANVDLPVQTHGGGILRFEFPETT